MEESITTPAQDFSQEEPLLPDASAAAPEPSAPEAAPERDFTAEAEELPDAVMRAALTGGETLLRAFLAHEQSESRAELERLREENRVFRQNEEAARRSPVQGMAAAAGDDPEADPFLAGFTSSGW